MALTLLYKVPVIGKMLLIVANKRAASKIRRLTPCLGHGESILDIGTGNGSLCCQFLEKGYDITPLDIENFSVWDSVDPVTYNGENIPFADKYFNTTLLITVLHHSLDPEKVVAEAARVSSKIIIVEEIYTSVIGKYWVYFIDSLFNLEFVGHPRNNKTDNEWRKLFTKLHLEVVNVVSFQEFPFLSRVLYQLKCSTK